MVEWIKHFDNVSDFGMDFLLQVPDQCVYFLALMVCLIVILAIRVKEPGSEEVWEED